MWPFVPPSLPQATIEEVELLREIAVKSFTPAQIQIIEALRTPSVIQGGPPVPDLDLLYRQAPQAVEVSSPAEVSAVKV